MEEDIYYCRLCLALNEFECCCPEEDDEEEIMLEIANNCTCGAYVINGANKVIHIADCFCGAD